MYGDNFFLNDDSIYHWNGIYWVNSGHEDMKLLTKEVGYKFAGFFYEMIKIKADEGMTTCDNSKREKI